MRGRKHPLEIFRLNGKTFVTTPAGADLQKRSRAKPAAEREPEVEREPADLPEGAPDSGPSQAGTSEAASTEAAPPGKRTKRTITMARSGGAQRRAAVRSRRVTQWSVAAAGLVLVGGLAYAAKLWLFGGSGAQTHGLALQRDESIKADWPDHAIEAKDGSSGGTDDPGEATAAGKGAKEVGAKVPAKVPAKIPAAAPPVASGVAKEYWVVAASVKLNEQDRKKNLAELRKELFKTEEQKLHKGLDADIGRYGFRVQTVATNQKAGEFVLRVGCATSADDLNLKTLLGKVIKLGGSFKNALIRDYPPATTK